MFRLDVPRPFRALFSIALVAIAAPTAVAAPLPGPDQPLFDKLSADVAACYDTSRGGFVGKVGVPCAGAVRLALVRGAGDDGEWRARGVATVDWLLGLRDTIGGGFLHADKDRAVDIPSFTKRTDSNAERLELLLAAWRATGDAEYREQAGEVADYFERVLLDGRGGFVAGQIGDRELMPHPNGLAIHAWLHWAVATADPRTRDFALRSLDVVWERCWTDSLALARRGTFGELLEHPRLEDQVEMGRAFALGARVGGRARDRARAILLGDLLLAHFEDREKGGFKTRAVFDRKKGVTKNAAREPDENARAARFLAELAALTGDGRYAAAARRTIEAFTPKLEKPALLAAEWALALRALSVDDQPRAPEWVAVVERERPATPKVRRYRTRVR